MILRHLHIDNFKNIAETDLIFSDKINCLLGDNGMGKSNLLDAIYYLSHIRSYTGMTDAQLIRQGEQYMILRGDYTRRTADEQLTAAVTQGKRKSFKRKAKEYPRLSEHVGRFPLVLISPADHTIITGQSEDRRRFIDMIISQSDPVYLDSLIRYNRALEHRNGLLRRHDPTVNDPILMQSVEVPMVAAATYIHDARRRWVSEFTPIFARHYQAIAGENETPSLDLKSQLNDTPDLDRLLDLNRQRDIVIGHTTAGPHRDDIDMTINGMPVRRIASQGQCKTYTIAMRLAQYEFLAGKTNLRPVLLLDDIFDKLDASRVERIIDMVTGDAFGQIFITDTNRDHLDSIMPHTNVDYRLWSVSNGQFTLMQNPLPL